MRAMLLEFPDDPTCDYLDRQYMLGPSLLVAPVFSHSGEVSLLPAWPGDGRISSPARWSREPVGSTPHMVL